MDAPTSASNILSPFVLFPLEGVVKEIFDKKALQDGLCYEDELGLFCEFASVHALEEV
jgi:hypothetical protein